MGFENLTEKLTAVFKRLGSKGKLIEEDIKSAMREVKLALLEADVNYSVAKKFITRVSEKALGTEIMKSLTPAQMVIKIVRDELVSLLGGNDSKLNVYKGKMNVIMLCGLQGAGKTTHCAKLAVYLRSKKFKPLIAACDIYRPAAIDQLEILGKNSKVSVFVDRNDNPVNISCKALDYAKQNGYDTLILDTAGRLHIDENLMNELKSINEKVNPKEILLVLDSMTGQDAVNVAKSFNDLLNITGVILTKFDGDARGGAALTIRETTGAPIKFIGTGEKLGDIEPFKPERIATRIIGMGDILSLIESAQENFDKENTEKMAKKFTENKFDFEDFLSLFSQMRKMGPLKSIISKLPGVGNLNNLNIDDKLVDKVEAVILSMTREERKNPKIICSSRKKRIASGSGSKIEDVNNLLKRFEEMKKLMKQINGSGFLGRALFSRLKK